jgi:hypothetical protein
MTAAHWPMEDFTANAQGKVFHRPMLARDDRLLRARNATDTLFLKVPGHTPIYINTYY